MNHLRRPPEALVAATAALRCPVCEGSLRASDGSLRCASGHAYDVARQGYANLTGRAADARADSAAMVLAREHVLSAGLFDPVTAALAETVSRLLEREERSVRVVEAAGGTGCHLGAVLDRLAADGIRASGLLLDLSVPALRRAARAHPRLAAVAADVTGPLPLHDDVADVVLSIFGPRHGAELRRILRTDRSGAAVVVLSPRPEHLAELVGPLGMLRVDPDKRERVDASLPGFRRASTTASTSTHTVDRETAAALVAMGPSAHHVVPEELEGALAELVAGSPVTVTVAVDVSVHLPERVSRPSRRRSTPGSGRRAPRGGRTPRPGGPGSSAG